MSRHGDLTIGWADRLEEDGGYTFRLGWGEIRKLEERRDAGPRHLLTKLTSGEWKLGDCVEVIRLGLEGGGSVMLPSGTPDHQKITRLIKDHLEPRSLMQAVSLAARILHACLADPEDEDIPKPKAGEDMKSHLSPAENTGSPRSTDGAPSSGTHPPRSIN